MDMTDVRDQAMTTLEHLSFGWRGLRPLRHEDPEFYEDAARNEEADDDDEGGSTWALFIWGALTALALWWLYLRPATPERRRSGSLHPPTTSRRRALPQQSRAQATSEITEAEPAEDQGEDDLTIIWGIGPARAARLAEVGITTFDALAVADMEQLRDILAGVGVETQEMDTWPEQASLAAKGDWTALEALQDRIRAERA